MPHFSASAASPTPPHNNNTIHHQHHPNVCERVNKFHSNYHLSIDKVTLQMRHIDSRVEVQSHMNRGTTNKSKSDALGSSLTMDVVPVFSGLTILPSLTVLQILQHQTTCSLSLPISLSRYCYYHDDDDEEHEEIKFGSR
jgi:hypothetical protein